MCVNTPVKIRTNYVLYFCITQDKVDYKKNYSSEASICYKKNQKVKA